MKNVIESDWKIYGKLIPFWRDRYLQSRNEDLHAILSEKAKSPTEKFWELKEQIDREANILNKYLGRFSRSNMVLSLMMMLRHSILQDKDLGQFSESLRQDLLSFNKIAQSA